MFLGLSIVFLTLGVFLDYNVIVMSLYFVILLLEFVYLLNVSKRMYLDSKLIGVGIIILTAFETILISKGNQPELAVLATPFLFFTMIQLAISDNLSEFNIDHKDIKSNKNPIN